VALAITVLLSGRWVAAFGELRVVLAARRVVQLGSAIIKY
jgi:hypothetical protein